MSNRLTRTYLGLIALLVFWLGFASWLRADGLNYAPSVMFDRADSKWKSWWCGPGQLNGFGRDAIHYSWSYDAANWSSPVAVFQGTGDLWPDGPGVDWDGGHTCDPSVIKVGNQFTMYYTGCRMWTDHQCRIGRAVSTNGTSWQRAGVMTLACDNALATDYGCIHFSSVWAPGPSPRWVALVLSDTTHGGYGTYIYESYDAVNWSGPNGGAARRLCFSGGGGCLNLAPKDLTWMPHGFQIAQTINHVEQVWLQGMTWYGTMGTAPAVLDRSRDLGRTFAPGFYREADGRRFAWWVPGIWMREAVSNDWLPNTHSDIMHWEW